MLCCVQESPPQVLAACPLKHDAICPSQQQRCTSSHNSTRPHLSHLRRKQSGSTPTSCFSTAIETYHHLPTTAMNSLAYPSRCDTFHFLNHCRYNHLSLTTSPPTNTIVTLIQFKSNNINQMKTLQYPTSSNSPADTPEWSAHESECPHRHPNYSSPTACT